MRVAVIGCGSIGSRHASNLAALGHHALRFDADLSKAPYRHPSEVMEPIDAAMICTPAATHAAVARELLGHGYRGPLFVEKPIALAADECDVFNDWPHPTMMVGYNWRWNADVTAWFGRWPGRTLPTHMTLRCDTDYGSWPGRDYAEPILECSHELDLALGIFGPALEFGKGTRHAGPRSLLVTGGTPYSSVRIELCWGARRPERTFIARFTGQVVTCTPTQESIEESYKTELRHFLACATAQQRPDCTAADGLRVLDALYSQAVPA